jgi:amino acid transporter
MPGNPKRLPAKTRPPRPGAEEAAPGPDLGPRGAFSIGIGGIVGGGIFATLGLAGAEARGATYLSFLIGGAVALLTAYSYVRLTLTYPGKGGTVTFITRAFGNGLFAGGVNTLLVLSYVVLMALYASAFGTYGAVLFPRAERALGQHGLTSAIIILLALLNLVSPRLVEASEGLFNLGKLGILGLFIVVGAASGGLALERLAPANWVPPLDIVAAGMLVFLSYEGFELIANSSDRIKDPARALPIAYYGSIGTAMALYVLIVVVAIGHLSFAALARAQSYSLCAAAEVFMGRFGFILLAVGAALSTSSAINADFFGASKLPVALAEQGAAPHRYTREVWGRHPSSVVMITVLALLVANFLNLHAISSAASAGFLLVFSMVNIANAKLAAQTGSRRWISALAALCSLGALATMLGQLASKGQHNDALLFIAGLAVYPFVYQLAFRRVSAWRSRRRASTTGAG